MTGQPDDSPDARAAGAPAELVSFLTTDLAGITRGRSAPQSHVRKFLHKGCGWVPANLALTPFDVIAEPNPWGPLGDLRLLPDPSTEVRLGDLPQGPPLHYFASDITNLDGTPWQCCPRHILKQAVAEFERVTGLHISVSFEQEFQIEGAHWGQASGFSLEAQRRAEPFPQILMQALADAGVEPEMFLPEAGKDQFEVPCKSGDALAAADSAINTRLITRDLARQFGWRATFSPKSSPESAGNGTHIHFSFQDADGKAVSYDPAREGRCSEITGQFAAGILKHLPALCAFTTPSAASYLRLAPQSWSAAFTCFSDCNREAALRICPTVDMPGCDSAHQYNLEFRVADATASPHLQLAALIHAGLSGVNDQLAQPPLINKDPYELGPEESRDLGIHALPDSLPAALDRLRNDPVAESWFPEDLLACYYRLKETENGAVKNMSTEAMCEKYRTIY